MNFEDSFSAMEILVDVPERGLFYNNPSVSHVNSKFIDFFVLSGAAL